MEYPALWDSKEGISTIVLCVVFEVLAIAAMMLRIWSRRLKRTTLVLNDYAAIIAMVLTTALVIHILLALFWAGLGHHMQDIEPDKQGRVFVIFIAGQPVWGAANTAVKISILHLYITIFSNRSFTKICYVTMAVSIGYFWSVFFEAFLLCRPVTYNWNKTINGTCADVALAYLFAGISNLLIDLIIVALPLPMLWRLQLPVAKKIGISAMFSIGAVICVITLLRILYLHNMDLLDLSYSGAALARWSVLEPTLGVVNACLPVMRPVLQKLLRSSRLTWTRESRGSSKYVDAERGWLPGPATGAPSSHSNTKYFHRLATRSYNLDKIHTHGNGASSFAWGPPKDDVKAGLVSSDSIIAGNHIKRTTEFVVQSTPDEDWVRNG